MIAMKSLFKYRTFWIIKILVLKLKIVNRVKYLAASHVYKFLKGQTTYRCLSNRHV